MMGVQRQEGTFDCGCGIYQKIALDETDVDWFATIVLIRLIFILICTLFIRFFDEVYMYQYGCLQNSISLFIIHNKAKV